MTREDVLKELDGLNPVIVHWDDAWVDSEYGDPVDAPMPHCTIGYLGEVTPKIVELHMSTNTDVDAPKNYDVPYCIPAGAIRAITRLVPGETTVFETTVRKSRTIDHGKKTRRTRR
jgi:hypothetical protein